MGLMSARRLLLASLVSLCFPIIGALIAAPAALAEELCPNAASRQGPSAALPDCRAYEQVTPVNKGDATDLFPSLNWNAHNNDSGYVAEDGNHFLLLTLSSFAGGDSIFSSYVFSRGADEWSTTSLSPGPGVQRVEAKIFNPNDLSEVGVEDLGFNRVPDQLEEPVFSDYAGPPGGPYTTVGVLPVSGRESLAGASADLSHVVLQSEDHELAPGDVGQDAESNALYEWFDGHLELVNVTTSGALISPCGATLGNGETFSNAGEGSTHNAVASDGSKIFFTAPDPEARSGVGCWSGPEASPQENPPELYMRLGGTSTVEISANPSVHDPDGPQPAVYVGASADGSKAFFMTRAELTADDTTHAVELYEYDTEAPEGERLVRVSSGESGMAEGKVDFVPAISSDGSTVYFTAFGKLAEGASALEEKQGGTVNLYRYEAATRKTTYITQVGSNEYPVDAHGVDIGSGWVYGALGGEGRPLFAALNATSDWYVTGNGRYLLFGSVLPLTGYDNAEPCHEVVQGVYGGEKCLELFRYSAADNSIVCVSCAGGEPTENASFDRSTFEVPDGLPPRPISEDGSYVFFETPSALVPQTTDKTLHVYEWHNGKISLISSPDDPGNAYFLGSSADGSNVFFGTHAQLVPQDTDASGDLYDARIDGGFAEVTPSLCTGTGCQGVPAPPPIFATPASVTFEGVGNFAASSETPTKAGVKTLTKAQKLARALTNCARDRSRRRRARCQAGARARYGRTRKSNKSNGRVS